MLRAKEGISRLLENAGVIIDGPRPSDPLVLDPRFYNKVAWGGSLGLGEAYVDGLWECEALDEFFCRLLTEEPKRWSLPALLHAAKARLLNLQSVRRARQVAERHYDHETALFTAMLGPTMAYSCGYWKQANTLCESQCAKFDLICSKLQLRKGDRLLDIGCGWGTFLKYAAERHGVRALGITLSARQAAFARRVCSGLDVEIRLQDYRSVEESFDKVVTIGMIEHVGAKNYRTYMQVVRRCLKAGGLALLNTIGRLNSAYHLDPWLEAYIFPNGMLPSLKQLAASSEGLFVIEDLHNIGADYDRTLVAWQRNFEASWPGIRAHYDEKFQRMWRYYLLSCAGAFRARNIQLWQIVFSPRGVRGGYAPSR